MRLLLILMTVLLPIAAASQETARDPLLQGGLSSSDAATEAVHRILRPQSTPEPPRIEDYMARGLIPSLGSTSAGVQPLGSPYEPIQPLPGTLAPRR